MTPWQLSVPATLANLGPGFDRLGLALDLRLFLQAEKASSFQLELAGFGHDIFPKDESNLMIRAYKHACEAKNLPTTPISIKVDNPIPIRSGMGSSAAAIVIGIALAREVHGIPWDRRDMFVEAIEVEGHPDNVAPAIFGGLIACEHQPEAIWAHRQLLDPRIHVLTAKPPEQALTKLMRDILPNPQPADLLASHDIMVSKLLEALAKGDPAGLALSSQDQLHQPHRLNQLPQAKALFDIFDQRAELSGAFLCGSGPTIGGWVIGDQNPAEAVLPQLEKQAFKADLRFLRPDQDGVRREETQRW